MAYAVDRPHWVQHALDADAVFWGCVNSEPVRARLRTPEEQAAWEVQQEEYRRRAEEAKGAEDRALALLTARLGEREAALFTRTRELMRPSQLWPGVEYLIPRGPHEMVQVLENGRVQTELCVVADQGEPWPDRTMAVLDLIESGQERRLWEMANVFPSPPLGRLAPLRVDVPHMWMVVICGGLGAAMLVAIVRSLFGLWGR